MPGQISNSHNNFLARLSTPAPSFSGVTHDDTLSGNGLPESPLGCIKETPELLIGDTLSGDGVNTPIDVVSPWTGVNHDSNLSGNGFDVDLGLSSALDLDSGSITFHDAEGRVVINATTIRNWNEGGQIPPSPSPIEYTGISPIVVNNDEHLISAESAKLGVQNPLYFVEDSRSATIIGIDDSAFPTFETNEDGEVSAINGSAIYATDVVEYSGGDNIDITNHVISVTGSVASADRADYAISSTSAHFAHSATESYSSTYTLSADSATYDNLGREITSTYLTAVTGDNTPYSAGANIDITNHVVSGKDWSNEIQDASANALNEAINNITAVEFANSASALTTSAGWDVTEYTAGDNINITNHVVSGKNWTNDITAASSYAYEQATGNIPNVTNLAYVQNSALYVDGDNNLTAISSYNVGHPQVPVTGSGSVTISKPGDTVIIHGKEYDSDISAASSYAYEQATAHIPNGVMFASALDYDQNNTITGYDGSAIGAQVVDYSAGANINITNHVVSGKNWTNDITGASSYAYNQATAQIPSTANLPYVQNSALKIDNNKVTGISGYEIGSTGSLYPQVPVVGVDGISITKQNDTVLIGLSSNIGDYVGIDPIVVDNVEGAISANTARFGVQAPLYFVTDTPNATVIGLSATDAGALTASSYSTAYIPGAWNLSSYNNVSVTYTGAFISGAEYRKISFDPAPTGPYSAYTQLTSGGLTITGNVNGSGSATISHQAVKVASTNAYTEIRPSYIAVSDSNAVVFVSLNASDLKCIKEAAAWVSAHSGSL